MCDEYAIVVKDLEKSYRLYEKPSDRLKEALSIKRRQYHRTFSAIKNFSMNVVKGETLGILGKNGAGKSTLLKMITGVIQPTKGEIFVNGKIAALLELGAGFNPEYTGMENIYLNGTLMGYSKDEIEERIPEILQFADIGDFINQPVKSYSSGMFARLAFSVAINVDPDILIVDEALSVGDVAFQAKCFRKFNEFKEKGKTILFVTHSLDTVLRYCTKAVVINNGEKVAEGNPKEMVDLYKKILVNIDDSNVELFETMPFSSEATGGWKSFFKENSAKIEYGTRAAEIVDYGLFDEDGRPSVKVRSDETVTIKYVVHFKTEIMDPIFAFTIKDLKGNELAGTNTWFQSIDTGLCSKDEIIVVTFSQKLNLQSGLYTLSLGCTGFLGDELTVYHRLYDVIVFEATTFKKIVGIFDIDSKIHIDKQRVMG